MNSTLETAASGQGSQFRQKPRVSVPWGGLQGPTYILMPLCQADWALLQMPHGGELADIPDLDGDGSLLSQAKQTELKGWDVNSHSRSLEHQRGVTLPDQEVAGS